MASNTQFSPSLGKKTKDPMTLWSASAILPLSVLHTSLLKQRASAIGKDAWISSFPSQNLPFALTTLIFISALSIATSFVNSIAWIFFPWTLQLFTFLPLKILCFFFHHHCTFLIILPLMELPLTLPSPIFQLLFPKLNFWPPVPSSLHIPSWLSDFISNLYL